MRLNKFKGNFTLLEKIRLLEAQRALIIENRDRMNKYIKDFNETILKIRKELDKQE